MDFEARYRALLLALQSHADAHGFKIELRRQPESDGHPFEFALCSTADLSSAEGTLFVFPPTDVCLTSRLLSVLTRGIARTEGFGGPSVLLFCDTCLPAISNLLQASGLAYHAQVGSYTVLREMHGATASRLIRYRVNWLPGLAGHENGCDSASLPTAQA
jgi:hypothetical protein